MRLDLPDSPGTGGYAANSSQGVPESAPRQMTPYRIPARRHDLREESIAGFVLYRLENGVVEYLLLKKVQQNDWSPPKGHVEEGEECFDGAMREVFEETNLTLGDYEPLEKPIRFEYTTRQQVLKRVHMWPARYLNFDAPVQLSSEHDEFQWLDYEAAKAVVKRQYKVALMAADLVIRTSQSQGFINE